MSFREPAVLLGLALLPLAAAAYAVMQRRRRADAARFAKAAAAERAEVAAALRRCGAEHLVLSTDGDWLRDLAAHLRRADQMRRSAMAAGGPGRAATAAHRVPAGAGTPGEPPVTRRHRVQEDA